MDSEILATYTYLVDLRDCLEEICKTAHDEVERARAKRKTYLDCKSHPPKLSVGIEVLLLWPTDSNKLFMQWNSPFEIVERKNEVDNVLTICGKSNIFLINMLKKCEERDLYEYSRCRS